MNSPDTQHSGWTTFLDELAAERQRSDRVRPIRALAEEFARRTIALLFPRFVSVDEHADADIHADGHRVQALLAEVVGPFVSDSDGVVAAFLERLPTIRALLNKDVDAIHACDPAAESRDEVILAYPGFLAVAVHRMAHELYRLEVPLVPRLLSEWAHRETGIDIHPGAEIGESFAIDHGTGIVIGESTNIGDRVRMYQGVTLGALAVSKGMANKKRHPTIGNDVVLYANATILGGNTVIGEGSVVGGNVWLTASVPPRSVVQFSSTVAQRPADDGLEFHI